MLSTCAIEFVCSRTKKSRPKRRLMRLEKRQGSYLICNKTMTISLNDNRNRIKESRFTRKEKDRNRLKREETSHMRLNNAWIKSKFKRKEKLMRWEETKKQWNSNIWNNSKFWMIRLKSGSKRSRTDYNLIPKRRKNSYIKSRLMYRKTQVLRWTLGRVRLLTMKLKHSSLNAWKLNF